MDITVEIIDYEYYGKVYRELIYTCELCGEQWLDKDKRQAFKVRRDKNRRLHKRVCRQFSNSAMLKWWIMLNLPILEWLCEITKMCSQVLLNLSFKAWPITDSELKPVPKWFVLASRPIKSLHGALVRNLKYFEHGHASGWLKIAATLAVIAVFSMMVFISCIVLLVVERI